MNQREAVLYTVDNTRGSQLVSFQESMEGERIQYTLPDGSNLEVHLLFHICFVVFTDTVG